MMQLVGKRVVVVGMGASGVAAAKLCLGMGARVIGTDQREQHELGEAARALPIEMRAGGHDAEVLRQADLVVLSPGIPPRPEIEAAERAGVEVIGELELGARLVNAPICAIGGTNGKSTTTQLLGNMFKTAGLKAFTGGNLGTPLCEAVGSSWDVLVVEVSSFQLERAPSFRPRVSVLLNITEDHLDRYASFAEYARAKGNAFANQTPDDVAIALVGDAEVDRQARRGRGKQLRFGQSGDYRVDGSAIVESASGQRFELAGSVLDSAFNHLNSAAAIAAARALGQAPESIQRALMEYSPLGHRLAFVGRIGDVTFYDDSKATNVGAAVAAVEGMREPRVVLVAGGKDKGGSYEPLVQALRDKGRAVVLIGEAADRMQQALGPALPVERAPSMQAAVERAYRLAQPGDAVLLSPACSSFDMFKNYAERGDHFVAAVKRLRGSLGEGRQDGPSA
jgi:UDP-N-acetylmuramoylalanine--D-glutamate ligase